MSESIGMMDKAYFVGKVVIIEWFNTLLDVSITSIYKYAVENLKD
jgi:hypothetical protein